MKIEVVKSVLWAGSAQFGVEIKIFWQIALNAFLISKEWLCCRALTCILFLYIVSSTRTCLTILDRNVEVE